MPSRWSISCWMTRASQALGLDLDLLAASRPARCTRTRAGALDLDVHAGQAQASLLAELELLARPLDRGFTSAVSGSSA